MRPLNEVPWEELRVGDKVKSAIGNDGFILSLPMLCHLNADDPDGHMVSIGWYSGKTSYQPHYLLDKVTWIGHDNET